MFGLSSPPPVSDNVVETRLVFPLPQKHRQKVKQERWLNIPNTGSCRYTILEFILYTVNVYWKHVPFCSWFLSGEKQVTCVGAAQIGSQCNIWASCSTIFSFGLVIKRASYLRGNTFQTSQSFLLLFFFISPGISKAKVSFCRSDPGFEQRASLSVINVPQVIYKDWNVLSWLLFWPHHPVPPSLCYILFSSLSDTHR